MDIINEFFRKHYPATIDTNKFEFSGMGGGMLSYEGEGREKRIFPEMVCADGFRLSVQGHYGAYSAPRDDFADHYSAVEVMCKAEPLFEEYSGGECGDKMIYGYVPIDAVEKVIAAHGGLAH